MFHANGNEKKDVVANLISDKIDFKTKTVTNDRERHYAMIKGPIQEVYNICIYFYIQHRRNEIHKANINGHNERN